MTKASNTCVILFALLVAGGCASNGETGNPDPWETTNRGVYVFNDTVDRYTLKPVSKGYQAIVPKFMRKGVSNFFDNLTTPRSSLNNFLQGKPGAGGEDLLRFVVNSTAGIGGLIDVASAIGMQQYDEDFGQTFAVWGIPDGPYVYLPFLGPNTLSDAFALPFDWASNPLRYYENTSARDKLTVLLIIDTRQSLLSAEKIINESEDPYIALREAYLQNREYRIYDGNPPISEEEEDLFEEFLNEDY